MKVLVKTENQFISDLYWFSFMGTVSLEDSNKHRYPGHGNEKADKKCFSCLNGSLGSHSSKEHAKKLSPSRACTVTINMLRECNNILAYKWKSLLSQHA